jgi:hypothetical protein
MSLMPLRAAARAVLAYPDLVRLPVLLLSLTVLAMFAGCTTAPQLVETKVPVPVECRVAIPARPAMPTDNLVPADPLDRKVKAMLAELEIREGYEIELLTGLTECTKPLDPAARMP